MISAKSGLIYHRFSKDQWRMICAFFHHTRNQCNRNLHEFVPVDSTVRLKTHTPAEQTASSNFASSSPTFTSSTMDEDEARKFSHLCSEWWNENGHLKALHSMNCIRVPWIKRTLTTTHAKKAASKSDAELVESTIMADGETFPLRNLHILDVGCGGGLLCEPLARLGACVTGVDAVEDSICVAEMHLRHFQSLQLNNHSNDSKSSKLRINYITSTVEELADKSPGHFDAVIASEVLEHVSNRELFLKACVQLLKNDGHLFVTTLNRTLLSKYLGIYAAENIFNIVPKGIHDWEKFTEPQTLQNWLENDNNCSMRLIHGLRYNPFTNRWSWTRDCSINYAVSAVKNER